MEAVANSERLQNLSLSLDRVTQYAAPHGIRSREGAIPFGRHHGHHAQRLALGTRPPDRIRRAQVSRCLRRKSRTTRARWWTLLLSQMIVIGRRR